MSCSSRGNTTEACLNTQFGRGCVFLGDEVLRNSDEVRERIFLGQVLAGLVPVPTHFPAAPEPEEDYSETKYISLALLYAHLHIQEQLLIFKRKVQSRHMKGRLQKSIGRGLVSYASFSSKDRRVSSGAPDMTDRKHKTAVQQRETGASEVRVVVDAIGAIPAQTQRYIELKQCISTFICT